MFRIRSLPVVAVDTVTGSSARVLTGVPVQTSASSGSVFYVTEIEKRFLFFVLLVTFFPVQTALYSTSPVTAE